MAGRMINGAAALAELVRPAGDTDQFGVQRVLPVVPELSSLLPGRGLRRGSTVAVAVAAGMDPGSVGAGTAASGAAAMAAAVRLAAALSPAAPSVPSPPAPSVPSALFVPSAPSVPSSAAAFPVAAPPAVAPPDPSRAAPMRVLQSVPDPVAEGAPGNGGTSLLLALLSAASRSGSWCAVVGVPALGALAAAESGIALDRLALVPNPGPDWPTVVAALIDGVDVVVTAVPETVSAGIAGRLVARARQRGSVLVPYGRWDGADVTLQVTQGRWEGLGAGGGRLRRRRVTVLARGRGAAARPREVTLWMPGVIPAAAGLAVAAEGEGAGKAIRRLTAVPSTKEETTEEGRTEEGAAKEEGTAKEKGAEREERAEESRAEEDGSAEKARRGSA
jgi:hypothetical protein